MLVLDRGQVEALLDVDALIDALAVAMAELSAGRAQAPPRVAVSVPERDGKVAAMPGFVPAAGALSTKLVSLFPRNAGTGRPTHQALIVAFDPDTGQPVALLDGEVITAARTAAGSALSARLLARPDAAELAVLGTGVQARAHVDAVRRVRPIRRVRLAGRDRDKAAALAAELDGTGGLEVVAVDGYAAAVDGADIVCATTHAAEPVVRRAWLAPGAHVTSVGFHPDGGEVDDETILEALLCVETRDVALAPYPGGSGGTDPAGGRRPAAPPRTSTPSWASWSGAPDAGRPARRPAHALPVGRGGRAGRGRGGAGAGRGPPRRDRHDDRALGPSGQRPGGASRYTAPAESSVT